MVIIIRYARYSYEIIYCHLKNNLSRLYALSTKRMAALEDDGGGDLSLSPVSSVGKRRVTRRLSASHNRHRTATSHPHPLK